jgi:hypothetical protein
MRRRSVESFESTPGLGLVGRAPNQAGPDDILFDR